MDNIGRVTSAGNAFYSPKAVLGPRDNANFLFIRIRHGSVTWAAEGRRLKVTPDRILLSPAGARETWLWDDTRATFHDYIHWDLKKCPEDLPPVDAWPRMRTVRSDGMLHSLFDHLMQLHHSQLPNRSDQERRALALMLSTFVHDMDVAEMSPAFHDALERLFDELRSRWGVSNYRPPSIEEMCRMAHVSKPHLIRLFRQHCSESPHRFCEQLRLHYGAHRLIGGTASIDSIARQLGYETQFHFSRNFKQHYGMPPLRFRRAHRLHPEVLSERPSALLRAYERVQHLAIERDGDEGNPA